jgi:hypothetical protein
MAFGGHSRRNLRWSFFQREQLCYGQQPIDDVGVKGECKQWHLIKPGLPPHSLQKSAVAQGLTLMLLVRFALHACLHSSNMSEPTIGAEKNSDPGETAQTVPGLMATRIIMTLL